MKASKLINVVLATMVGAVLILGIAIVVAEDDDTKPLLGQTGPRPGEHNPNMSPKKFTMFRDDEILLLYGDVHNHDMHYMTGAPTSSGLTAWDEISYSDSLGSDEFGQLGIPDEFEGKPPIDMASGRLADPKKDQVALAYYRPDGSIRVEQIAIDDSTKEIVASTTLPGGTENLDGTLGVAVIDLDLVPDDEGYLHDEIVVAYGLPSFYPGIFDDIQLTVLDSTGNLDVLATAKTGAEASILGVEVGDFDGDGIFEIVVGQAVENGNYQLTIYSYTNSDTKGPALTKESSISALHGYKNIFYGGYDMTVGDFTGNGKDEIIFYMSDAWNAAFYLFSADDAFKLTMEHKEKISPTGIYISIQSGLFFMDPDAGYDLNRRTFVSCTVDPDLHYELQLWTVESYTEFNKLATYSESLSGIFGTTLSAGNFIGHQDSNTDPSEQIAFTGMKCDIMIENCSPHLRIIDLDFSQTKATYKLEKKYAWAGPTSKMMPTVAIAHDRDGDSYYLGGPPVHIVIESLLGLDYVIHEPPKHVDFLPLDPTDPKSEWDVINVSAYEDFYVEFVDESSKTVKTETKSTSSMSIGHSTEWDVKSTVSAGESDIAKVTVSGEYKTKVSQEYEEEKSKFNDKFESREVSYESKTTEDDYLLGRTQLIDIWRYPIHGLEFKDNDDNKSYGFQEIVVPGPIAPFSGAGRAHADWYQPVHMNHNVLSYPRSTNELFPLDLGAFKVGDKEVTDTMNKITNRSYGGAEQKISIVWTEEAGAGSDKSYNNTYSTSKEITLGIKAEAEFKIFSADVDTDVTMSFDKSVSTGGSSSTETTNSVSKGIYLNIPSETGFEDSYDFKTAIYISSEGGMFKVAHATDVLNNTEGAGWWKSQYGGKTDPGLNLPNRFVWEQATQDVLGHWELVTENNRKRMRGFFIRESKENKVSKKHDVISGGLVDGDNVLVCARVYNNGLYHETGDFTVRFEYIPIDTQTNEEADTDRTLIENLTTSLSAPTVDDIAMKEVCGNWNTTGLSDVVVDGQHYSAYRLYVTLDPEDNVKDEIHEWKDADGNLLNHGNNEGYWPWGTGVSVTAKSSKAGEDDELGDIMIPMGSLGLKRGEKVRTNDVKAAVGKHYRLRATIDSRKDHSRFHHIFFYDGHPDDGGTLIASRLSFGLSEGDNYIWADWTPKALGKRTLYVHIIEDVDDANPGDSWDTLKVNVVPYLEDDDKHFDSICGCSLSGTPREIPGMLFAAALFLIGLALIRRKR